MKSLHPDSRRRPGRFIVTLLLGMAAAFTVAVLLVNFILLPWHVKVGREAIVPDVRGMSREEAQKVLQAKGFAAGDVRYVTDTSAFGRVVDTRPRPGMTVKVGRVVGLDVSGGQEKTQVPQVYRLPLRRAQAAIENAGLRVGEITMTAAARVPEGLVIAANPASGLRVLKGTAVALTISSSGANIIEMPNLKGLPIDRARDILLNLQLTLLEPKAVSSPEPPGTVLTQVPTEGTEAFVGDTVRLTISSTPKAVKPVKKDTKPESPKPAIDTGRKSGKSEKPKPRAPTRRRTG